MDTALPVRWVKSVGGDFLDLLRVNLEAPYFAAPVLGVYVIWYTGAKKAPVVKVGQGNIKDQIIANRTNIQVTQYSASGQMKISWVIVNRQNFDGVEAFLYDYYKPLVGERNRAVKSIPVTPLLSL